MEDYQPQREYQKLVEERGRKVGFEGNYLANFDLWLYPLLSGTSFLILTQEIREIRET